jgi:hypothetical protein
MKRLQHNLLLFISEYVININIENEYNCAKEIKKEILFHIIKEIIDNISGFL